MITTFTPSVRSCAGSRCDAGPHAEPRVGGVRADLAPVAPSVEASAWLGRRSATSAGSIAVLFLLTFAFAAPAIAQPGPPDVFTFAVAAEPAMTQGVVYGAVDLVAVEPFERNRPVTGAPYSAEAVTEVTQALSDGNRIERRTSAKIARDGRGRIRREHQAMAVGTLVAEAEATIITISDPVAGTFVTLDSERRTAMQSRMSKPSRTRGVDLGQERVFMTDRMAAMGGTAGVRVGPGVPYAGGSPAPAVSVQTDSLGTQTIEGVRAEGQRTTTTIPPGAIGNQQPIEIVSERWFSPELQVVVLTRRSDPRFGETVYRLTSIMRAEPPATLFQVPPDYRIEEPELKPYVRPKPDGF